MKLGANCEGNNHCEFIVWAPYRKRVSLIIGPSKKEFEMEKTEDGYWRLESEEIKPGSTYLYRLDEQIDQPDPASHFQPEGVFGPSMITNQNSFKWKEGNWQGINLKDMVFYELHVGTFTQKGTFEAASERIGELAELGINAVELMPIAQFSGNRNWGYDGVFPYAVQNTYGSPDELKRFIDHCHQRDMAVILDVVFNHLGPEGNCLPDFGPYFLKDRKTLWGPQVNFDGRLSFHVRNYFLENAIYWFRDFHVDGLRLDAVHTIIDTSRKHFLKELAETVKDYSKKTSRKLLLIAESDQNDPKIIRPGKLCGYGLDAQWLDDFHHALYTLLTGEKKGYYIDFGRMQDLVKSFREGYVYSGQYSRFRNGKHGYSSRGIPPGKFLAFSQNHDQIGNRMLGERLLTLAGLEAAKLAAGIVILSPYIPLLFMGEEYGERDPFLYFTSYMDRNLAETVRKGRKEEFTRFDWQGEPPDPQSVSTFKKSKINWQQRHEGLGKKILEYYKNLIRLRKTIPAIRHAYINQTKRLTSEDELLLFVNGRRGNCAVTIVANFNKHDSKYEFPSGGGSFVKVLDSADPAWAGRGSDLPDKAIMGDEHVIRSFSIAVFLKSRLAKKND